MLSELLFISSVSKGPDDLDDLLTATEKIYELIVAYEHHMTLKD